MMAASASSTAPAGRTEADKGSAKSGSYDAFISYSRHDRVFTAFLQKALEGYLPPRGLGIPRRHLKIFRDESDLTGVEYHAAIRSHLENSSKLIVVCSPQARASGYVDEEIRHFTEAKGATNIIPVLLSGTPNNEARPEQESNLAFPQALVDVMEMPLAVDYSNFDVARKHQVTKGAYYGTWCTLLANLFGLARGDVEQRETRRRAKRIRMTAMAAAAIAAALSIALVVTLISRNEAATQRDRAIDTIGRILSERAWQDLDRGAGFLSAKYALAGMKLAPSTKPDQQLVLASILERTTEPLAVLQCPGSPRSASFGGPAGDLVVTTGEDGEVRVWDWGAGKQIRTFTGHELTTNWASFAPAGKTVVSSSSDATARVWDVISGEEVLPPLEHMRPVVWASYSPDGSQIISVSRLEALSGGGQGLHLWNARDGKQVWATEPPGDVLAVAFARDGRPIDVVASGVAEFRDRKSGALLHSRRFGAGAPTVAAIDAAHDLLVLAEGNQVTVFRLGTGEQNAQFASGAEQINALAIDPSGSRIAVGGDDGIVRIWESTIGYLIATQAGHTGRIVNLAFNSDGSRVVTVGTDATIRIWNASRTAAAFAAPQNPAIASNTAGSRLVLASADKLSIVEIPSFRVVAERNLPAGEPRREGEYTFAVSFSTEPDRVVIVTSSGEISSHGEETGDKVLYRMGSLFAAALSPGAKLAAVVRFESPTTLSIVDLSSGQEFALPGKPGGVISQVHFSADGARLAAGAQDGWVSVWDTVTRKSIMSTEAHPSPSGMVSFRIDGGMLQGVALSDDGKLVGYILSNGISHVRDIQSSRDVAVLHATEGAKSIAFTRDGRLVAMGGSDGVTLYDLRTTRWLADYGKPSGHLAFTSDSRFLIAGGDSFSLTRSANKRLIEAPTDVWDITRVVQSAQELAEATCTQFLASDMHRFSENELAADPILRGIWSSRSAADRSLCQEKP